MVFRIVGILLPRASHLANCISIAIQNTCISPRHKIKNRSTVVGNFTSLQSNWLISYKWLFGLKFKSLHWLESLFSCCINGVFTFTAIQKWTAISWMSKDLNPEWAATGWLLNASVSPWVTLTIQNGLWSSFTHFILYDLLGRLYKSWAVKLSRSSIILCFWRYSNARCSLGLPFSSLSLTNCSVLCLAAMSK